jgi:hypothetical protein
MADAMTYTKCPICDGSLMAPPIIEGHWPRQCPCAKTSTPGFSPTGLTLAQIDRMVRPRRALAGDVGIAHAERGKILADLGVELDRAMVDWTKEGKPN